MYIFPSQQARAILKARAHYLARTSEAMPADFWLNRKFILKPLIPMFWLGLKKASEESRTLLS